MRSSTVPRGTRLLIYLLVLLIFLSVIAEGDKGTISHDHNDGDISDSSSVSGCALNHFFVNVTVCQIGIQCFAPLHGTVVLPCNYTHGTWLHNSSTLDTTLSSNLALTDVHYHDSGRYLYDIYDIKKQNTTESCDYLLSVGDPPIITAPGLLCTEGCCQLPIMTVYSNANDVYQVCNTSFNPPDTTNILWYDDGTPAKGVNDEQRYRKPYYLGLAGTTVNLTCVVSNHYGNTTLAYNVHVIEAPSDDLSKYKEALGLNVSRNYSKGSDVELPFAMYQHQSSIAKFCHFSNNTYKLLFGFLEFNQSTCCYCELDDCSSCTSFTVSSTTSTDELFYNFTIHLNDIKKEDVGLYTMLACVYQVNARSCGTFAYIEVLVKSSKPFKGDKKFLLFVEIGSGLIFGTAVCIVLYCCCSWCLIKVLGNRKKNSSNSSSSVIPLASPTENSRGVGGSNSQGSDTSSEVTVSQRSNNNTTSTPTQNTLVVTKKSSSTAAPVSVTGTPSGSGGIAHKDRQRLVFNGQPYTAMSRQASVTYADETGISDGQQLQHFQHSSLGHQTDHEADADSSQPNDILAISQVPGSLDVERILTPSHGDAEERIIQGRIRQGLYTSTPDTHPPVKGDEVVSRATLKDPQSAPPNCDNSVDHKTDAGSSQPNDFLAVSQVSSSLDVECILSPPHGDAEEKIQKRIRQGLSTSFADNLPPVKGDDKVVSKATVKDKQPNPPNSYDRVDHKTESMTKTHGGVNNQIAQKTDREAQDDGRSMDTSYMSGELQDNKAGVIVYCKDDDCDHFALKLCNFLRRCCVNIVIDLHYSSEPINNWSQWIEQRIKNSAGYNILLCGKALYKSLQKLENERIEMHDAHIGVQTLNSLIDGSKTNTRFVPVFIGEELVDCIPTSLKERCHYTVQCKAEMEEDCDVNIVLNRKENKSLCSLVAKLTGQPEYPKPPVNDDDNYNSANSNDDSLMLTNAEQFEIHNI